MQQAQLSTSYTISIKNMKIYGVWLEAKTTISRGISDMNYERNMMKAFGNIWRSQSLESSKPAMVHVVPAMEM